MTTPILSDPREDKLPKWAQEQMAWLRRRVESAEQAAEEARLTTDPDASDTIVDRYDKHPIGLGTSPRVVFRLPAGDIEVRISGGRVEVRGDARQYGQSLVTRPRVSNGFDIGFAELSNG